MTKIYVQPEPSQSGTYRVAWSARTDIWDPEKGDGRSAEFRKLKALDQAGIAYATSQEQRDRLEAEARARLSDAPPESTPRLPRRRVVRSDVVRRGAEAHVNAYAAYTLSRGLKRGQGITPSRPRVDHANPWLRGSAFALPLSD